MDKEDLFEKRMRELGKKAYYRGILTFSDFLDLSVRWRHSSLRLFLMSRIIPLPV